MKRCDLHSHSNCSDGSLTPTELVRLAEQEGVAALALTDHNTSKGLAEFMEAGKSSPVITVAGCEFSTDYHGTELHIVGLFFPEKAWTEIEDFVELMHIAKRRSNEKMIAALQRGGYDITYDEVAAITDADEFNRAHVARVLVAKGYMKTPDEAFKKVLRAGDGFYEPPKRLEALTTVQFIKMYGGVPVLAHPFLNLNEEGLMTFLPQAKERGLAAIETRYSLFDEVQTKRLEELAVHFGLKQSGGSDFHGAAKPDIRIGSGKGTLCVPFSFYENLKP